MGGAWFDWLLPLRAYKLSSCFSPLPWLYPSKQAVDCFMLFAHLYHVLFSHLKCSVKQVLTTDPISLPVLLALADYWSWRVWIMEGGVGNRLNKFIGQYRYTTENVGKKPVAWLQQCSHPVMLLTSMHSLLTTIALSTQLSFVAK